jgi:hypothetical protein
MRKRISATDLKPDWSLVGEAHVNCVDDPKVKLAIVE